MRRAFTLIELLVVIGIMSLLLSILVPALGAARERARACVCLCNLKQIGAATFTYVSENNDYLPRASMTAGMGPPMEPFKVRPWGEALVPQLGMCAGTTFGRNDPDAGAVFAKLFRGTYRCPSDDVHIDEHWEYKATQLYLGHWSYGKNVLFEYNNAWDRKYDSFATFGAINRPADTVLFGEILATQMSDHFMVDAWLDDGSNATVDKARHGKTSNYIFADFHAEPAAFKNIFNPADGVNHFDPNQ